ncbi:MAG: threonylcarbamoyl-AMP synthase [Lachnospiraceae bacterium]|nr:threonylcarbamoyl-AMP synthase [Lachnospiraceae bacterium]
MNTLLLKSENNDDIIMAAGIIKNGGLVAFPTETVYGLGADALVPEAAAKIYSAKGRPSDNPLIVHIAETEAVEKLALEIPDKAKALMEAFWPGPLTIILKKKTVVPDTTTGGLPTVAIRMPSHPAALQLIRESGCYIAAPSANTSGRPSPTTAAHVEEDMTGRIDAIIDGGPVGIGIESTIVDMSEDIPTILRPGFITKKMLENIVGEVKIDPALESPDSTARPKAPGMRYTHYAPKGELTIVESSSESDGELYDDYRLLDEIPEPSEGSVPATASVINAINDIASNALIDGHRVCILTTEENADCFEAGHVITVGSAADGGTVAARLYAALRECDAYGADIILSEAFAGTDLSSAIMNRLIKAAGHRVIKV